MRITDYQEDIAKYKELLESVRLEVALAYKERDKILSEIRDQRAGINEISNNKKSMSHVIGLIADQLDKMSEDRKNNRALFYKEHDKFEKVLSSLKSEIEQYQLKQKEFSSKELDLEKIDNCIKDKQKELKKIESEFNLKIREQEVLNQSFEKKSKELDTREKELFEKELYIKKQIDGLTKKEYELNTKEKRLEKLKIELKK